MEHVCRVLCCGCFREAVYVHPAGMRWDMMRRDWKGPRNTQDLPLLMLLTCWLLLVCSAVNALPMWCPVVGQVETEGTPGDHGPACHGSYLTVPSLFFLPIFWGIAPCRALEAMLVPSKELQAGALSVQAREPLLLDLPAKLAGDPDDTALHGANSGVLVSRERVNARDSPRGE